MQKRKSKGLDLLILVVYTILMASILLFDLFLTGSVDFSGKSFFYYSNSRYLLSGIGIIFLGIFLAKHLKNISCMKPLYLLANISELKAYKLVLVFSMLMACIQLYLISNYYYRPGWDVGYQILPAVEKIASGDILEEWQSAYFSQYPNNLLLVSLFSLIRKIDMAIGVLDVETGIMCLIVVQCAVFSLSAYWLYKTIYITTQEYLLAWIGWLYYIVFIGLSPWFSVPYSDAFGLFFPIFTLYLYSCYLNSRKNHILFIISLLGYLSFKIKPQASLIFISIIISEGIEYISGQRSKLLKHSDIFKKVICILFALILMSGFYTLVIRAMPFQLNENATIGWQHFFMMGLNPETGGIFSEKDVNFSNSFSTNEERNEQNLNEARRRIHDYGFIGLLKHSIKKTMTNFSDGTFAWGAEGTSYQERYIDRNAVMSPALKSIYYTDGIYHHYWKSVAQICWMVCLLGMTGVIFHTVKTSREQILLRTMILGVIGIATFELMFEARARYLFTFTPIFVILSVLGWSGLYQATKRKIQKMVEISH